MSIFRIFFEIFCNILGLYRMANSKNAQRTQIQIQNQTQPGAQKLGHMLFFDF